MPLIQKSGDQVCVHIISQTERYFSTANKKLNSTYKLNAYGFFQTQYLDGLFQLQNREGSFNWSN